jgi:hypothetical protein
MANAAGSVKPRKLVHTDAWVDAQQMAHENPSYYVPNKHTLDTIQLGDCLKISNGDERFYVRVVRLINEIIVGMVTNMLVYEREYNFMDLVHFKRENVIECHPRAIADDRKHIRAALVRSGLQPEQIFAVMSHGASLTTLTNSDETMKPVW